VHKLESPTRGVSQAAPLSTSVTSLFCFRRSSPVLGGVTLHSAVTYPKVSQRSGCRRFRRFRVGRPRRHHYTQPAMLLRPRREDPCRDDTGGRRIVSARIPP